MIAALCIWTSDLISASEYKSEHSSPTLSRFEFRVPVSGGEGWGISGKLPGEVFLFGKQQVPRRAKSALKGEIRRGGEESAKRRRTKQFGVPSGQALSAPCDTYTKVSAWYIVGPESDIGNQNIEKKRMGMGRGGVKLNKASGVRGAFWVDPGCPSGRKNGRQGKAGQGVERVFFVACPLGASFSPHDRLFHGSAFRFHLG